MTDEKIPSEHWEQVQFVSKFRKRYKGVLIFAIPNGGKRGKGEAARLKAEGVEAGIPDMYVPEWRLWIEMKRRKGGYLSEDQKKKRVYLESILDSYILSKGYEDGLKQVEELRGH